MELANGGSLFSDLFYKNIEDKFTGKEEYSDNSSIDELNSHDDSIDRIKRKQSLEKRLTKTQALFIFKQLVEGIQYSMKSRLISSSLK